MNKPPDDAIPEQETDSAPADPTPLDPGMEQRLSGAYRRILRLAITLSVAGTPVAALLFSWRSGLGLAIGSLLAYINFVWLHRGTERLVGGNFASNQAAAAPNKIKTPQGCLAFPLSFRF